ncbi:MarR family winged helix-turn-helix transcriptional regulator [Nocardia sp. NPDC057353]|uniref:MarR family winged helix-turn-helix transcriptional regulator n=1 Tax=Nocardia sp. NPDC057353 TaxID=3346104 RepID=UPI0036360BE7
MDDRLLLLLHRASRSAVAYANVALGARLGISLPQLATLSLLSSRPDTTPSRIAKELDLNKSAVTSMVQRLERAELIARSSNDGDGRSTLLHLREPGRRVRTKAAPVFEQVLSELTAGFTAAEIEVVLRFLNTTVERCGSAARTEGAHG